ncbi:putative Nuclease-related domain containing protein [Trypanosoma cruzi]|uniref:NERD domain-containing protein n=1 Tax=Trypanosoma cruzi TaxID=5693 RepID=A0A7J6YI86_TRYCR|nr:hypothetical protein ECC02_000529 [Trypanosoma cruzi]KAF8291368.1 putative Nuclease-related domain containing protein [Trypanosoma cruzi]
MGDFVANVLYWLPTALMTLVTCVTIFIAVGLAQGFFRNTLSSLSWRNILFFTAMSSRQKQLLASMQAEELVEAALRSAGWKHVFLRRRVPVQRLGHNREIDVVAVGPVVLVVEVKHWRGQVWSNGSRWFQCPDNSKRALEFEDIQEDNLVKAAALRRFIENDRRIPLSDHHMNGNHRSPTEEGDITQDKSRGHGTWYTDRRLHKQCGEFVLPVVVFTNPAVVLDPSTVKQKKRVFNLASFQLFAEQLMQEMRGPLVRGGRPWGRLAQRLRSILFGSVKRPLAISIHVEERVAAAVETMRTWDMIYLHSGRLIHGDVTELHLPSIKLWIERKHILDVEVWWFDGFIGLLRGLWEGGGGMVRVRFDAAQRLLMGRDEIAIPIAPRNLKHMTANDRLVVKTAGSRVTVTVALADVCRLRFSHHMEDSHS